MTNTQRTRVYLRKYLQVFACYSAIGEEVIDDAEAGIAGTSEKVLPGHTSVL